MTDQLAHSVITAPPRVAPALCAFTSGSSKVRLISAAPHIPRGAKNSPLGVEFAA